MTGAEDLPTRVRARVVTVAADALGSMPPDQVPASLRRVASFPAARRARVAAGQLLAALDDDDFRSRLAVQARAQAPAVADALDHGECSAETAALAFLVRADGWQAVVAEVAAGEDLEQEQRVTVAAQAEVAVLRVRVAERDAELDVVRRELEEARAAARTDATAWRRKVGEARALARDAAAVADAARAAAEERLVRRDAEAAAREAEAVRSKDRIAALEAELTRTQRGNRAAREDATLRARLLLDTLLQAGHGLRQELGLPVVDGAPADRVEADLAEVGVRAPSGAGSLALDDPARVRELLTLPRLHLIVDGYNVTRYAWDRQPLEAQRARLLTGLAPVAARSGAEITVVFDGANADVRPPVVPTRGVRVLFSPRDVLADDVIRDLVDAEPPGRPLGVVTSDQEIVRDVTRRAGVYPIAAAALVRLLA